MTQDVLSLKFGAAAGFKVWPYDSAAELMARVDEAEMVDAADAANAACAYCTRQGWYNGSDGIVVMCLRTRQVQCFDVERPPLVAHNVTVLDFSS